jgi:DNA polymerase-3 subunit gamma/tau
MAELKDLAAKASLPQILKAVKLFGQLELGFDSYSTLPLELALVDCALTSEEEKESLVTQAEHGLPQPIKVATPPVAPPQPKQPAAEPELTEVPIPAVPEAVTITPPEPGSEIEQLRLNWKQVIEQAPENTKRTPAIAILRSAGVKPVAFEDDAVVLAFRYPYHKEQIEKPENKQVAEKIISNFLGRSCHVRCIYEPEDNHLVQAAIKMGAQVTSVEEK